MSRTALDVTLGAPRLRRLEVGPFRVSDASFAGGHRIASHFHGPACLSVVTSGRFVQRFPGRECDCPPDGVILKPPGERHEDRWLQVRSRHVIVELEEDDLDALGPCAGIAARVSHRLDPVAGTIARRIQAEIALGDEPASLAVEGLVFELFAHLAREDGRGPGREPPAWLMRVRDGLHDRFTETPTLAVLAAEAGVHRSHLARSFARWFGCPVGAYVRRLRLEAAKRVLAHTDRPLSRVALECGFSDQSHLTRSMRAATDQTPGDYRRRHGRRTADPS